MPLSGVEDFCGGPLWDANLTWHADVPQLTPCFQQTVLTWVPVGISWLAFTVYILYLSRQGGPPSARSPLNIAKLVFGCLLVGVCAAELCHASVLYSRDSAPVVTVLSPTLNAVTFGAATLVMEMERRKRIISSGVMFIIWLIHVVFGFIIFYSVTLTLTRQADTPQVGYAIVFYIRYIFLLVELALACVADVANIQKEYYPEYRTSFLSRVSYNWMNSLVINGYREPLTEEDIWEVDPRDSSVVAAPELERTWKQELNRSRWFTEQDLPPGGLVTNGRPNAKEELPSFTATPDVHFKKSTQKRLQPSLFRALAKTYGLTLLQSHFCKLVCDVLTFVGPLLQSQLIGFTEDKGQPLWIGIVYALLFLINAILNAFFFQQLYHIGLKLGARIRTAIMSAVYKKAMTLNNEARKDTTIGGVVNLMSVDAQRLQDVTGYLWMIWSSPLQITIAVGMLWHLLGAAVLAGIFLMVLLLPANVLMATRQRRLQQGQMTEKDSRLKLMSDILNGIKIVKLYAWELSFRDKIAAVRNLELASLQKGAYLTAVSTFTWTLAPFAVMLSTFTAYVLTGNVLTPAKAFVALSLFNILHFPINLLPVMISNIVTARVSIHRIGEFLRHGDMDSDVITHSPADDAVHVENGIFQWATEDETESTLRNINVSVKDGTLVAVVGLVGSGKSSLLSAILGEMDKLNGNVNVKGRLAYVAQEAWIQNATVRENITFGKDFDRRRYDSVIEACALKSDLDLLTGGDQTEIGEKGTNLSGGQRQRVSLARAVYHSADIYLLDDPLSAVDSCVGKHIFEQVISRNGVLRHKTRIMVTHGLHWLPKVDHVIVLTNGEVSESGTYTELTSRDGPFSRLSRKYLQAGEEERAGARHALARLLSHDGETPTRPKKYNPGMRMTTWASPMFSMSLGPLMALSLVPSRSRVPQEDATENRGLRRLTRDIMRQLETSSGKRDVSKTKLIKDETREVGQVKWAIFLAYGRALGLANAVILLTSYIFFQSTSILANIWVSRWTGDPLLLNDTHLPNSSEYIRRRNLYLGVYSGLGLGQALFILIYAVACAFSMVRASRVLHDDILHNVLRSPMAFFDTTPIGRIINRFSRDVDTVDNILPQLIRSWMNAFFLVFSSVLVIGYSTPVFLSVTLPLGVLYYFIQRFYIPTSRQLKRLESTTRSPIFSHFSETMMGASTIRAYGQQDRFVERYHHLVDRNVAFHLAGIASNRWLGFRLDLLSACIVFGAALFAVFNRSSLTAGLVGLSISYALQATSELNWMVRVTSDLESNVVSVERLQEYAKTPTEAEWYKEGTKLEPGWPQHGKVEFIGYSTRYRPGLGLVLDNISATIQAGEKIGVVGRTGAGKSSLALSLFRLLEAADGEIKIDGRRISDLGLHDLRSRITILPQEPMLFSGTLRANLDPLGKQPDDALWRALEKAHLQDFVSSLPSELDYECEEAGQNLSVGQRQLVCLARALLHRTAVLILDEATAAVDAKTDELVQHTIREEFADSTVITIAHRIHSVMDSDRIMVLDAGHVAELDKPSELLANTESIFYGIAKSSGLVGNKVRVSPSNSQSD